MVVDLLMAWECPYGTDDTVISAWPTKTRELDEPLGGGFWAPTNDTSELCLGREKPPRCPDS